MEPKNRIISVAVSTVIIIALLVGFVYPVFINSAINAGTAEIVNGNAGAYGEYLADTGEYAEFKIDNSGVYYNGDVLDTKSIVAMSDAVTVIAWGAPINGLNIATPAGTYDTRVSWGNSVSIVFDAGVVAVKVDSQTAEYPYNWAYLPSDGGEYVTLENPGQKTLNVSGMSDLICAGYYSSGENDTYYYFHNGAAYAGDYKAGTTYDKTAVGGYLDYYQVKNFRITVDDENFNPWYVLIKKDITVHKDNEYSELIQIIPIIITVGVIVGLVGVVVKSRIE